MNQTVHLRYHSLQHGIWTDHWRVHAQCNAYLSPLALITHELERINCRSCINTRAFRQLQQGGQKKMLAPTKWSEQERLQVYKRAIAKNPAGSNPDIVAICQKISGEDVGWKYFNLLQQARTEMGIRKTGKVFMHVKTFKRQCDILGIKGKVPNSAELIDVAPMRPVTRRHYKSRMPEQSLDTEGLPPTKEDTRGDNMRKAISISREEVLRNITIVVASHPDWNNHQVKDHCNKTFGPGHKNNPDIAVARKELGIKKNSYARNPLQIDFDKYAAACKGLGIEPNIPKEAAHVPGVTVEPDNNGGGSPIVAAEVLETALLGALEMDAVNDQIERPKGLDSVLELVREWMVEQNIINFQATPDSCDLRIRVIIEKSMSF